MKKGIVKENQSCKDKRREKKEKRKKSCFSIDNRRTLSPQGFRQSQGFILLATLAQHPHLVFFGAVIHGINPALPRSALTTSHTLPHIYLFFFSNTFRKYARTIRTYERVDSDHIFINPFVHPLRRSTQLSHPRIRHSIPFPNTQ